MNTKHRTSNSGTKNAHISVTEDDSARIFVHLIPPKRGKRNQSVTIIFTYAKREGQDGWKRLTKNLSLKEGDSVNHQTLKNWLASCNLEHLHRNAWVRYIDLRDGRI